MNTVMGFVLSICVGIALTALWWGVSKLFMGALPPPSEGQMQGVVLIVCAFAVGTGAVMDLIDG